jgi:ATP-binding cassette subfamily F protein 3
VVGAPPAEPGATVTVTAPRGSAPKTKEQKRAEAEARNRAYRSGHKERTRLGDVEAEIAEANAAEQVLLARLAEPDLYADKPGFDAAMAEYAAVKSRLAALESEWLDLSEAVEEIGTESAPAPARAPRRRHGG